MAQGSLPLHMQISELLIREIASGRLIDGARLPPERDMAANLGIAVGTLRKALTTLAEKGLLTRLQGSGNYVRAGADPVSVYSLFRLELASGGGLPTAQILSIARVPKDAGLPAFGSSPDAQRIRRLRFLSGIPAAVEEIWLDAVHAPMIDPQEVLESLYLYYRERLGLVIARVEDLIGQHCLPPWAPANFPHPPGATLPFVTRIGYAQDGTAAETSRTWYDPVTVRYAARFR